MMPRKPRFERSTLAKLTIIYQRFVTLNLSTSLPHLKQLEVSQACLRFLVNKSLIYLSPPLVNQLFCNCISYT